MKTRCRDTNKSINDKTIVFYNTYPLELFLRVITVRQETMKIVEGLPKLEI